MIWIVIIAVVLIPAIIGYLVKPAYRADEPYTQVSSVIGLIGGFLSIPLWLVIPIPVVAFIASLSALVIWKKESSGARNLVMSIIGLIGSGIGLTVFVVFLNHGLGN